VNKIFNVRALALGLFTGAVLAAAAPAGAQTTEDPISVSVSYADLDIGHAAGAEVLLQRIKSAAVRACGGAPHKRALRQRAAFDDCRVTAISQAVAEVNSPALTELASSGVAPVRIASR
jgi:UrcA family protein